MVSLVGKVGSEFQVNTTTADDQTNPAIAALAGGGFVVTWMSSGQDGSGWGVYAQRYDAAGMPQGAEFRVNTYTTNQQEQPAITAFADGGFVVTWMSSGQDGSNYGVYAQRYDAAGMPQGGEFLVNTHTTNGQVYPTITTLADGGFVIAWASVGQDSSDTGIYAQRYSSTGVAQGNEFQVNTYVTNSQFSPAITALADDGFVVTWVSQSQDGDSYGVYAQRYNSSGGIQGTEFRVNTYTANDQWYPTIAALAGGGFVITWMSQNQDGDGYGVYAQRYDATGVAQGGEFQVSTYTANDQSYPTITALSDGGFVVTWTSVGQDGSSSGIYAQRYDALGVAQGGEFLVNTYTTSTQSQPAIAALADGGFAVAWQSNGQDGSSYGVYAQRYEDSAGVNDLALSNLNVSELAIANMPVATIDAEGSDNAGVTYALVADGSGGAFAVQGNQLVVVNSGKLDFETAPTVAITIRATDANGDSYDEVFTLAIGDAPETVALAAGDELRANATTASNQFYPAIAALADGGYIVTWASNGQDGNSWGVYAQRYDASGAAVGAEFPVNTTTTGSQLYPTVAPLAGGGFVVAWYGNGPGDNGGIFAQRYSASGVAQGSEVLVNSYLTNEQAYPAIAVFSDGGFVVTWMSWDQDGSRNGVYAQRYNAAGAAQGGEFPVNTYTASDQAYPAIAALKDGGFVVTWMSIGQDGDGGGVYARRYDASGVAQGGEFPINTTTGGDQGYPAVAALADGGYIVAWHGNGPGDGGGVYAQRYDENGAPQGSELLVNTTTANDQSYPTIAALADGGFVVSWMSYLQDGGGYGVYAQRYDENSATVGGEILVNTYTAADQRDPVIAALTDGGFAVAWASSDQDGSSYGIYTRAFTAANDAPEGTDGAITIAEDATHTFTAADFGHSDPDGDALAGVRITTLPTDGTLRLAGVAVTAGQTIAAADLVGLVFTPAANANGAGYASFTFEVFDGVAYDPTPNTIVFDVTPVNDAPVNGVPGLQSVSEDGSRTFSTANGNALSVSDVDVGSGSLEVTLSVAHGALTLSGISGLSFATGDGTGDATMTFSGTAADINAALEGLVYAPDANYHGGDTLNISTSDLGGSGSGGVKTDSDTVTITVTPVNDAPVVANAVPDQSIDEDTAWSFTVPAGTFSDIDGDTLTYGATLGNGDALPAWLDFDAATRVFTGTPPLNFNGSLDLKVTASDGALTASDTFTLTVNPVNDAPVGVGDLAATVAEGGSVTLTTADLGFGDVEQTAAQIVYTVTGGTANGALRLNGAASSTFTQADVDAGLSATCTTAARRPATVSSSRSPTAPAALSPARASPLPSRPSMTRRWWRTRFPTSRSTRTRRGASRFRRARSVISTVTR